MEPLRWNPLYILRDFRAKSSRSESVASVSRASPGSRRMWPVGRAFTASACL